MGTMERRTLIRSGGITIYEDEVTERDKRIIETINENTSRLRKMGFNWDYGIQLSQQTYGGNTIVWTAYYEVVKVLEEAGLKFGFNIDPMGEYYYIELEKRY